MLKNEPSRPLSGGPRCHRGCRYGGRQDRSCILPILTHLLRQPSNAGLVVYISPLKALINDQWGRLSGLCGRWTSL